MIFSICMADKPIIGPTVICSAFIEKDGKFLLVFCPRFKVWRVPGGRAEKNETVEESLLRELEEEVGVKFNNPKFLGFGQDHQYHVRDQRETSRLLLFFHVKTDKALVIDPDEAEKYTWVTFEKLQQYQPIEGALTNFFLKR